MPKIKIVEIIPSLNVVGGAQTMFVTLCEEFSKKYNNIIDLSVVFLYAKQENFLYERIEKLPIKIYFLNKKKGLDFKNSKKLYKILKIEHPDVVHSHLNSYLSLFIAFLFKKKIKIFHTVHHIIGPEFKKEHFFIKLINKSFLSPVCVCENSSNSLMRYTKLSVPFINNGIEISNYKNSIPIKKRDITFLCVASFTSVKNHKYLVECFRLFKEKNKNIDLYCLGDGPLLHEIKEITCKYGLTDCLHFCGNVSNVNEYMSRSKILLITSLSEANPMVINEALASGMYIVANKVGGIPNLIKTEHQGRLVEIDDIKSFVKEMEVCNDVEFLENCRKINSNNIDLLSSTTMAQSYLNLFIQSLNKK